MEKEREKKVEEFENRDELCGRCRKNKSKYKDEIYGFICWECDDAIFKEEAESAGE